MKIDSEIDPRGIDGREGGKPNPGAFLAILKNEGRM